VVSIVLNFVLFLLALYDVLFTRRMNGDPTRVDSADPSGDRAVTYGNPGYRESNGVSMTVASGRPYSPPRRPYSPGANCSQIEQEKTSIARRSLKTKLINRSLAIAQKNCRFFSPVG
jgi:hypothetical protein